MAFLTDQQVKEQQVLMDAMKTITKVEPRRWGVEIYTDLRRIQEDTKDTDGILIRLESALDFIYVTVTSGDNVSGWTNRTVYLSDKQKETILAWVRFALEIGGRVEEDEDSN